jgi:excisionase family DNA binding protein
MTTLPDKELLKIDDVATYYGVKPKTVRGWIATGKLLAVKVVSGWRVRREDALSLQKESID